MCECIRITYRLFEEETATTVQVSAVQSWNGQSYYTWNHLGTDYFLYYNESGQWEVSNALGGTEYGGVLFVFWKESEPPCPPLGSAGSNWVLQDPFAEFTTEECVEDCGCGIVMSATIQEVNYSIEMTPTGELNGQPVFQGVDPSNGLQLSMWFDGTNVWNLSWGDILIGEIIGVLSSLIQDVIGCPISSFWENREKIWRVEETIKRDCKCIPIQDRIFREYTAVQLPIIYVEEDRGFKICCDCPMLVLAGGDTDSFKNDITSAWIKLSDSSDSVSFTLLKNGVPTAYTPPVFPFVNEPNAFYTTIPWRDVLASDGVGCYKLIVKYNIAGIQNDFVWGMYDLLPYTIENALKTARIRVKFNLKQEVEGINFTGTNVEDTIRFYGFIGERQPNTEIDNLIYQDRKVKSVVRENLDTYIITTDPLRECFIRPLTDLYLLSENEMWISDYNAHNHSYRIQDVPVILEESPEIDYLDILQRRAKLTAKVGLKTKNRRTFY
jgi:hypothetical protein